ncbi:MAG: hypothetical protein NT069_20010 [Planctomycetota bacterium]|nr:hypothetical protein [Planctomycetota bacterium]
MASAGLLLVGMAQAGERSGLPRAGRSLAATRPKVTLPAATATPTAAVATPPSTKPKSSIQRVSAEDLPPAPAAEGMKYRPGDEFASDGFPPLRGYVPGQSSPIRAASRTPDRGATETYVAFGRQSVPLMVTDSNVVVPRLMPCHRPLYFEDALLERHGVAASDCVQPGLSAAHFFGSVAIIPYKLLRTSPCAHVSTANLCGEEGEPTCWENFVGDNDRCDDDDCDK